MSFKDQVQADIDRVFLQDGEFAEKHNLNGTVCLAVVEGLTTEQRSVRAAENYEGMYKSALIVHVKAANLPEVPVCGEVFKLDGKLYLVDTADNDMGMLTIGLAANSV